MIIVNADDWGGWTAATDAALKCFAAGRITSVTAMVFMADSQRAASLATQLDLDVGLHLNLNHPFTGGDPNARTIAAHARICRFLRRGKYAQLLYNPWLRKDLQAVYRAQHDEFQRLYGKPPSHVDGHQHMHLCSNMLVDEIIPAGERVRRSFSFWPGEKGLANRMYRRVVDWRLAGRYRITDYFFALSQNLQRERLTRVMRLAREAAVELMTHPEVPQEFAMLMSGEFETHLQKLEARPYAAL